MALPTRISAATPRPRDRVTAVRALELAHAYICDVRENLPDIMSDPAASAAALNDVSLASKELTRAEQLDDTAMLTIETADAPPVTYSLTHLQALTLFYEGLCRAAAEPARSVRILEQATVRKPDLADAYFWIGLLQTDLTNRTAAMAALDKAVALEPNNLEYRKALGRAENISGAQIAFERTATTVTFGAKVLKRIAIGFAVLMFVGLVASLADPQTRGPTILGIFIVFAVIGMLVDMVKTIWADLTGRSRKP